MHFEHKKYEKKVYRSVAALEYLIALPIVKINTLGVHAYVLFTDVGK